MRTGSVTAGSEAAPSRYAKPRSSLPRKRSNKAAADVEVAALITTMPGREAMLDTCLRAVRDQCRPADVILIGDDVHSIGHGARTRNRLLAATSLPWVAFCDDDDRWMPNHLQILADRAVYGDVDVVVSLYDHSDGSPPVGGHHCDYSLLPSANWFHPSTCLLRRELVLDVGGFPNPRPPLYDDWSCWIALQAAGAKFACVHEVSNVKRIWSGGISQGGTGLAP